MPARWLLAAIAFGVIVWAALVLFALGAVAWLAQLVWGR